ncbi:uncharacterized protein RHOBADRAFT_50717 [Rhodotorula graminis WP1]|uniref:Zn(2)-C6 fungal-type domain-containing protein n=1 Tax=Rhodotorula graminis (strain WP1) TaxID=578459 RepID=A0A194SBW5_RHOGW|nr:uncharacterized protein RHOBADRAFT_50717 [Rhodotorula graminis WP1]KPV78223.1 hypothetical protein RHOBADRAFT_50717 [Rhodotorula graminis WP1]
MADTAYPGAKVPRRKRSNKSGLNAPDGSAGLDDAKRVSMACVACRKRKIRCDGAQPGCHNCSKSGKSPCRYERVTAEENLEVKMRKRLAKLRKELSASKQQDDTSSQLGARRRWSRTISFDKNSYVPPPPAVTSTGSVPYLSPSPSGLSTAAHGLHLDSAGYSYHHGHHGGYFDHPGSPYPITPTDEAPEYFVSVPPVLGAPRYPPFLDRAPTGHSPYPLTPPMDDGYSCATDPNCACHQPVPAHMAPPPLPPPPRQQHHEQRRPSFPHSQSAPLLPSATYQARYSPSSYAPPAPPPLYPHERSTGLELAQPMPVRAQPPSFIRAEPAAAVPLRFSPYPIVPVSTAQDDAFLAPGRPANWADALGEDAVLDRERPAGYTELWIGEQSKAPLAAAQGEYSHFEQAAW